MNDMWMGAIAMASLAAGLYFLRFWRSTGDRFFLFFALSFWIEAANRVGLASVPGTLRIPEEYPVFYLIRLLAFILILYAILDKNRSRK